MRLPALALVVLATTGAAVVAGCGLPASKATSPHALSAPSPIPRVLKAQPASRSRTPVKVRPLRHVVTPDLMLTTRAPLTQSQVARVLGLRGVTSSTVISTGAVRVGHRAVNAP